MNFDINNTVINVLSMFFRHGVQFMISKYRTLLRWTSEQLLSDTTRVLLQAPEHQSN